MIAKEKRAELLMLMEDNLESFKNFEVWEKDDEEVAKYALSKDSNLLKFSGPETRKNRDILTKVLNGNTNKDLWYYVDDNLRKDYDFVNKNMSEIVIESLCMKMHLYKFFKPGREEFLEKCKKVSGIYKKIPNSMKNDEIGKYILNLNIGNSYIFKELNPDSYDKTFVEGLLTSGKISFIDLNDEQKRDSYYQVVAVADEISSSVAYRNALSLNLTELSTEEEVMDIIRGPLVQVYTTSYFEEEEAKEIIYNSLKKNETFKKIAVREFNKQLDNSPLTNTSSSIVFIQNVLDCERLIVFYEEEKMKEDLLLSRSESVKIETKPAQRKLKKF